MNWPWDTSDDPAPIRPGTSLVASAQRIAGRTVKRTRPEAWQDEAWDLYDEVGELRFAANVSAHAISRARIFAARMPQGASEPHPIEDDEDATAQQARAAVDALGGGPVGRAELLRRLGIQLFVPGDGFLVGLRPGVLDAGTPTGDAPQPTSIGPSGNGLRPDEVPLDGLTWHILSVAELQSSGDGYRLRTGPSQTPVAIGEDEAFVVRVWRPHPRRWWSADSPVRASLPVLRELVGLTKHVGANIDSRLAGAGLLLLSKRVEVMGSAADPETAAEDSATPFVDALIDAMVKPLEDRDTAASIVPLIASITEDVEDVSKAAHWLSFSTPFDKAAKELRDEAIRRLALGLDMPPEVLLGTSSLSHWAAWAVKEENATTHVAPQLALVCDALTTEYLWPVLEQQPGISPEVAREFVVWFDLSDLIARPNRIDEAGAVYDRGELSGVALRAAAGFDSEDAPDQPDRAVEIALKMIQDQPGPALENPELIDTLIERLRDVLAAGRQAREAEEGGPIEVSVPVDGDEAEIPEPPGGTPDTDVDAPEEPAGLTSGG